MEVRNVMSIQEICKTAKVSIKRNVGYDDEEDEEVEDTNERYKRLRINDDDKVEGSMDAQTTN